MYTLGRPDVVSDNLTTLNTDAEPAVKVTRSTDEAAP